MGSRHNTGMVFGSSWRRTSSADDTGSGSGLLAGVALVMRTKREQRRIAKRNNSSKRPSN
jgi:hypothetical protein